MKNVLITLLFLITVAGGKAQRVAVYTQLAPDSIAVSASSEFNKGSLRSVVNGDGMQGRHHDAHNLGKGMWLSEVSKKRIRYNESTREGVVWLLCDFGKENPLPCIDLIQIWNYNQNEHTRRGLKKVYIEYSSDGKVWHSIRQGKEAYHIVPESIGRNPEAVDFSLETPGLRARYICFTAAADGEGNHYDRHNPVVMQEAADMHQDIDYYGLSEIRFFRKETLPVQALNKLTGLSFVAGQGYLRSPEGPRREFALHFPSPLYAGASLSFRCGEKKWSEKIPASAVGIEDYAGCFPAGYMEETATLTVTLDSPQGAFTERYEVPGARKWTVCFFPHSHLDIGYTHRKSDVMKLQWRNLERTLDLAERTKNYPDGARYRWNTEVTWPVAAYLEEYAGTEKAGRLIKAIREGVVNVDMALGSILTGISRQEELMHIFDDAHRISRLTGVELNTAMMSDVPGQAWGVATAMAKNGVKYYSPGPNYVPFYGRIGNDRAAALHVKWGDRPFYWQSQSGTDRVLVWQAGRGYSWFHGWLANRLGVCGVEPIWDYLAELEKEEFPYPVCYLRYTVHGDNGPPDESMPDVIRRWNERYESPHFRISTAKEFFTDFEARYGARLPTYGGDMTPTWEDGAASTARETAMNRETSARLAQTEVLWSMLNKGKAFPAGRFAEAWKNVVLFSEHTWGAAASGTEPYSRFTKDLWEGKKAYADSANIQSRTLYNEAQAPLHASEGKYIHVLNTNLWPRTDIVCLSPDIDLTGKSLEDVSGKSVAIQRKHKGGWCFLAEDIPGLSSAVYRIVREKKGAGKKPSSMIKNGNRLDNGLVRVAIDTLRGTIRSLKVAGDAYEYAAGEGLNDYLYTGHIASDPRGVERIRRITVLDDGAVAATLRIESDAPGCRFLWRDVTVYKGIDRVDICNTLDKEDVVERENVRFVFPFGIGQPEVTMDLAMSEIHPEREQLAGVNKHYYSLQNGIAVGDLEHAVCLTTVDAPFVELGSPSGLDYRLNPRHGYGWWLSARLSPVVYSWVMTNSWRTNYKASQEGIAVFRYSLQPCHPLNLDLKRRGIEREAGLVAVRSDVPQNIEPLFRLKGRNRIAVSSIKPSADGLGYIVCLHNMNDRPVCSSFLWGSMNAREVVVCDYRQQPSAPFDPDEFWMKPYEYIILKVVVR
ncbi:MAG: glycosyl hydrolase family 38 [Parabacteroides sp.]|nr:glycosyl hydrolase family 38 [Parabacteroides sp.]